MEKTEKIKVEELKREMFNYRKKLVKALHKIELIMLRDGENRKKKS